MNHRRPIAPRTRRPLWVALCGVLSVALAAAAWFVLAPQGIGGSFSYVFVQGSSMSPAIRHGDVVLLRTSDGYRVGDIVAARNPHLGIVLHRITADNGERVTLRGDNRPGDDFYAPTYDEIVGRLWVRIPGAAPALNTIRGPDAAAILLGTVLALALLGRLAVRRQRRPIHLPRGPAARSAVQGVARHQSITGLLPALSLHTVAGQHLAGILVALLVVAGALWLLVSMHGTERTRHETLAFQEHGRFDYGGEVPGGVYDDNRLAAPNPVFLQLVHTLPITYEFSITPRDPSASLGAIEGTVGLVAELHHQTGWSRTVELQPPTPFSGDARIDAVLEPAALFAMLEQASERTGLSSEAYQVRVSATVEAAGLLDGIAFAREHRQAIEFRLSPTLMQLDLRTSALESTETGTVTRNRVVPRTLDAPLLPLSIRYAELRVVALGGGGAALAGLMTVLVATLWFARLRQPARIEARYGHLLARVESVPEGADVPVRAFEDLVRIAEQRGQPILHIQRDPDDHYLVFDEGTGYRYSIFGTPLPALIPQPALVRTAPAATKQPPAESPPKAPASVYPQRPAA